MQGEKWKDFVTFMLSFNLLVPSLKLYWRKFWDTLNIKKRLDHNQVIVVHVRSWSMPSWSTNLCLYINLVSLVFVFLLIFHKFYLNSWAFTGVPFLHAVWVPTAVTFGKISKSTTEPFNLWLWVLWFLYWNRWNYHAEIFFLIILSLLKWLPQKCVKLWH